MSQRKLHEVGHLGLPLRFPKTHGIERCDWFIVPLLFVTLTIYFPRDHKGQSHKWNSDYIQLQL